MFSSQYYGDRRIFIKDQVKYGKKNKNQEENCFDIEICPDLLVAGIGAFGALALGVLYVTITMEQAKRRRKRGLNPYSAPPDVPLDIGLSIKDVISSGKVKKVLNCLRNWVRSLFHTLLKLYC